MDTKLLFTDIDGTLLRSDNTISDNLKLSLQKLAQSGHGMVLSSGRPLNSILGVLDTIGVSFPHTYIIAHNGALVYDYNHKKAIYEKTFPLELVDIMQTQASERNLHIQTYTLEEVVTPVWNEEIDSYVKRIKIPAICSSKLSDALTTAPYKMLAIDLYNHDKLVSFQSYVQEHFVDQIQTMFSNPTYLELIHKDASKGDALRFLCDYIHIPIDNSFAVGDSDNDLSMIIAAGTGYAMQNATETVKKSAAFTTALDHNHDGIIEILEKHFL